MDSIQKLLVQRMLGDSDFCIGYYAVGFGSIIVRQYMSRRAQGVAMLRSGLFSVSLVLVAVAAFRADADPKPLKVPKELLEKRLEAARKVFEQNLARIKTAQGLPSELFGWSERWLEAELALTEKKDDRAKALQDHLDRTREVERVAVTYAKSGQGRQADADAATYYRLEVEIRLLKEGAETRPAKNDKGKSDKK
jgi:hypothetical protein